MISPNGGETLTSGQSWMITWDTYATSRPVRSVRLLYTKDYEAHWETIMSMPDNYGSWSWRVPSVRERKDACKVKIELRDADGVVAEDKSLGYFKIDPAP